LERLNATPGIFGSISTTNATYYQSLTTAAANVRMLGINAANVAFVGAIDAGPVSTIFNASSTSLTASFYTSGTEKMTINSVGSVGISTTSLTGYSLRVSKNITGATSSFAVRNQGVVQSDVTADAIGFRNDSNTQAAAFTLTNYWHFWVNQGSIGAGSAITNQYGFYVDSNMIGAVNTYGYSGGIPSGTNRWNLYMSGTASNYLQGNLLIGTATNGASKLRIVGLPTSAAGLSSGDVYSNLGILTIVP
jgi:hypothetical protein